MATQHTDSSVRVPLDGHRQQIRFENADGEPIPHDDGELVVKLNGDPLQYKKDYSLSKAGKTTLVVLHAKHPNGFECIVERHTALTQPRQFNRANGANLKAVEGGLDRVTRACQDALRRIEGVERLVQVEHRVVEIPAEQAEVDPVLVAMLAEHMTQGNRMSEHDASDLATAIASVVVNEFQHMTNDLARRIASIEAMMDQIAQATGEAIQ